jgi:hypothetical protein
MTLPRFVAYHSFLLGIVVLGMPMVHAQSPAPRAPAAPAPVAPGQARAIPPAPAAAPAPAVPAVSIVMEDQNRQAHDTAALRGDVIVLLYADRNGAESAHEVGQRLHVHFHPNAAKVEGPDWVRQPVTGIAGWPEGVRVPNVHAVAVACLPEIPKAVHPVVRSQIRKESPHVPVWLDFKGTMPKTFGMAPDVPNILVIDTYGRPQGVLSGELNEAKYQQLVAAIDRLRLQAQPVRTASATEAVPAQR